MTSKSKTSSPSGKPPAKAAAADAYQLPAVPGKDIEMAPAFPGEIPKPDDAAVELLASQITEYWMKSVEGILAACKLCAEGQKYDNQRRQILLSILPFGEATFSKLASKVGWCHLKHPRKQLAGTITEIKKSLEVAQASRSNSEPTAR